MNMYRKKLATFLIGISCITCIGLVFGADSTPGTTIFKLTGKFGERFLSKHSHGQFDTLSNAGEVDFSATTTNMISGVLTGSFFLETSGWSQFDSGAKIVPPTGRPSTDPWPVIGYAWNPNVGWIDLQFVTYNPLTKKFEGNAWNRFIGWIPMQMAVTGSDTPPSCNACVPVEPSAGFVGKVKIIGNLGGSHTYQNLIYAGEKSYDSTNAAQTLNTVRKNISLLRRNLTSDYINQFDPTDTQKTLNNTLFYENAGYSQEILAYSTVKTTLEKTRSLIVMGGNIYIDTNVSGTGGTHALIAMKNEVGMGGNIYVKGDVTRIESMLIAEGSIYSAEISGDTPVLYNPDQASLVQTGLPNAQLYIKGGLVSHNTIGGSAPSNVSTAKCPYTIDTNDCTYDSALQWDMNYFRNFTPASDGSNRGYPTPSLDNFSIIIESDGRIIADPPPGL